MLSLALSMEKGFGNGLVLFTSKQEHWGRAFGFLTFGFFLVRQLLPQSFGGMYPETVNLTV